MTQSKIIDFLNDLIASFDKRLITYGENVVVKEKVKSARNTKSGGKGSALKTREL